MSYSGVYAVSGADVQSGMFRVSGVGALQALALAAASKRTKRAAYAMSYRRNKSLLAYATIYIHDLFTVERVRQNAICAC